MIFVVLAVLVPTNVLAVPTVAKADGGPTPIQAVDLYGNWTWSPDKSPYVLTGQLRIMPGGSLTILPGTVVKLMPRASSTSSYSRILVMGGGLYANGTAAAPITITSGYDDSVGGDSNGDGGATVPHRGDWYSIEFSALSRTDALRAPVSTINNAVIKYGGASSGGACTSANGMVEVEPYGRVDIRQSELLESQGDGFSTTSSALVPGIGYASVSNSRFADSGCGATVTSGLLSNNLFESSLSAGSMFVFPPSNLKITGNWVEKRASFWYDWGRDKGDVENNALLGGFDTDPASRLMPDDLSENWWGHVLDEHPTGCYDYNTFYIPLVTSQPIAGNSCGNVGKQTITGYLIKVLPALNAPPSVPKVGVGALSSNLSVPDGQTYGGSGGSGYGYRPTGSQADPVDTALGAFTSSATDMALPADGLTLAASRTYTSADGSAGPLGRGWSFGYDIGLSVDGDRVTVRTGDGQRVAFTRQDDGSYRPDAGVTATLAADDSGGFDLVTRDGLDHHFDQSRRIQTLTDRNTRQLAFAYNGDGDLVSVASAGREIDFTWNAGGDRLTGASLPDGRSVEYSYTDGLLTAVRGMDDGVTHYEYDAGQRLNKIISPAGRVATRLAYDSATGRVTDQWDGTDHHTTFGFDAQTGTATMTDPRGGVWTDVYQGNVIRERTDPTGATTRYEYDDQLQLIAVTSPNGAITSFGYTSAGDLCFTQGPAGTVLTRYNDDHLPVASVNAKGTESSFDYNTAGDLTKVSRPNPAGGDPLVTTYSYDDHGQVASMVDARGDQTQYEYNSAGDLTKTIDPSGDATVMAYDQSGRLTDVTAPKGMLSGADPADYTTHYSYDDVDRILKVIDPLGHTTQASYDADGLLTAATDAKGHTTSYGYNDLGELVSTQGPDPDIPASTATYDANGNTASITDVSGRTISYTYDAANRPITATTPIGVYSIGYNQSGQMTSVVQPNAAKTIFDYTLGGQLAAIDYPGTGSDVTFGYDADGNRTSMTDPSGTTSYSYDALDQLTAVTKAGTSFQFGYDTVGNQTSLTYPDGTSYAYSYDPDGRLTAVDSAGTALASYSYDANSNLTKADLADGSSSQRSYDNGDQLTRILDTRGDTTLVDETYSYDKNANPVAIGNADGTADRYVYDILDRLTKVCYDAASCDDTSAGSIAWTYDRSGNILTETRAKGTTTNSYNAKGQLTGTDGPNGQSQYSYNNLGQRITAGTTSYTYDTAGHTKTITTPAGTNTYSYDGDGHRISTTAGGTTTNTLWNPVSNDLAVEQDSQHNLIRRYSYGTGPIGMTDPSGGYYYHTDRLGSVRALTNSEGDLETSYSWEPYGASRSTQSADGAPANPIQWTGQYADPTGLYHLRSRQYDPATGTFTSTDPAGAVPVSSTYSYALANPMVYTDPLGLAPNWRNIAETTHTVASWVAVGAQAATLILAASGIGAPLAPFTGAIAVAAGVVTVASAGYLAYDSCTGGKGSCSGAIVTAALDTATALPGGFLAKSVGRAAKMGAVAKVAKPAALTEREIGSTMDDVLDGASFLKQAKATQYTKPGGFGQANADFDALTRGVEVTERGGGLRTATLSNGTKVNVRPFSSGNDITLEVVTPGNPPLKIRYVP